VQSFIRKFTVKFLEVAGAGLASALCAYILGQIERAPAPTPMPAVVYISPANVDTALREDHARPAEIARIDAETPPEAAASAPAAGEPKAVKPATVAQARRNQKPEPGAETKARGGEPLASQPAAVAANSAPKATAPAARAAAGRDEAEDWRIVRCSPDSGRSRPGSCRKTTGFSAICRGRRCRWAIRCEARCRCRYRIKPSAIGAAAAARLVPILRRRLERRPRCLKSKRESPDPRAFFGPVFIAIRQPLARVPPQFRSSIVPGGVSRQRAYGESI
jgi:hypothetical protein